MSSRKGSISAVGGGGPTIQHKSSRTFAAPSSSASNINAMSTSSSSSSSRATGLHLPPHQYQHQHHVSGPRSPHSALPSPSYFAQQQQQQQQQQSAASRRGGAGVGSNKGGGGGGDQRELAHQASSSSLGPSSSFGLPRQSSSASSSSGPTTSGSSGKRASPVSSPRVFSPTLVQLTPAATMSGVPGQVGAGAGGMVAGPPISRRTSSAMSMMTVKDGSSSTRHKDKEREKDKDRSDKDKDSSSSSKPTSTTISPPTNRRESPTLPHQYNVAPAPATVMYWSKAPVYGDVPLHSMRAHSVTLVENTAWVFGGCDEKDCWRDVYCFDIETMQWSHPSTMGDTPPRCRAHTATLVDRKIVFFGGGQGSTYYNSVYVLDTVSRRWTSVKYLSLATSSSNPTSPPAPDTPQEAQSHPGPIPAPRRAHTAVLYQNKIWVFGGGNGMTALNDVWTLDVSSLLGSLASSGSAHHHHNIGLGGSGTSASVSSLSSGSEQGMGMYGGYADHRHHRHHYHHHHRPHHHQQPHGGVAAGGAGLVWKEVETTGRKPGPRGYHTANVVGSIMIVVGGSDGKECFSDIWCLNLDTLVWSQIKLHDTYKRLSHTTTQIGSYLFILGGHDGSEYTSSLLAFNLVSLQYEPRVTMGKPPASRGYHASVLADSRLWVFGGYNGASVFGDVCVLDLAAAAYLPQVTSFAVDV